MKDKKKLFKDMTSRQQTEAVVRLLKGELEKSRQKSAATLKDIEVCLLDKLDVVDYNRTHNTKLYTKHGGEYCELASLLAEYEGRGLLDEMRTKRRNESGNKKEPEKYWGIHYITTRSGTEGVLIHESFEKAESTYRGLEALGLDRGMTAEKKKEMKRKIAPFFVWGGIDTKDVSRGAFLKDYKGKFVEMIDAKPLYIDM